MNSKSIDLQPFYQFRFLDWNPSRYWTKVQLRQHLPLDEAKLARIKNQSPAAVQPGWASENPTKKSCRKRVGWYQ